MITSEQVKSTLQSRSRSFEFMIVDYKIEGLAEAAKVLFQDYLLNGDEGPDYGSSLIRVCRKVAPEVFHELLEIDFFGEPRLDVNSILGALVDLKLGGEDFWRRIAANVPAEMKTLVFSGLWNVNQEAALEFLKKLPNTQSAGDNLYVILSFKNAAPEQLKGYIEGCQEEIQSAIRDFMNEKS